MNFRLRHKKVLLRKNIPTSNAVIVTVSQLAELYALLYEHIQTVRSTKGAKISFKVEFRFEFL